MLDLLKAGVFDSSLVFENVSKTPERITEYYEIELYISGEGHTFINSVGYRHEKYNLVFAKPGQKRYSKKRFVCLYVHLRADEKTALLLETIPDVIRLTDHTEYVRCYNDIIRLYETPSSGSDLLVQSKLYELLHMAFRDGEAAARCEPAKDRPDTRLMKKAMDFIDKNYTQPIVLKDIADSVHLSPVYFHKLFKIQTGKTPAQFLFEKRISAAKMYLLTTDFTVNDIAEKCGFSSLSYFDYSFHKECGVTPSAYRRKKYVYNTK